MIITGNKKKIQSRTIRLFRELCVMKTMGSNFFQFGEGMIVIFVLQNKLLLAWPMSTGQIKINFIALYYSDCSIFSNNASK